MTVKYFSEAPLEIPSIDTLVEIAVFEIVNHFKLRESSLLKKMIAAVIKAPARKFARIMHEFDGEVANENIHTASKHVLRYFCGGLNLVGKENIPQAGPVLAVANHPGSIDAVATMASIERTDQHIVVIERPLLVAMPNFSQHTIYVDEEDLFRLDIMRQIISYLQRGEVVIVFPRGNLEPDPVLMKGASKTVADWSKSIGVFLRKVPETVLVPLLISNVLTSSAWNSLIARTGKTEKNRHQIAMIYQVAMQQMFPKGKWKIPVHLQAMVGRAARELCPSLDVDGLNRAVQDYFIKQLLLEFPKN